MSFEILCSFQMMLLIVFTVHEEVDSKEIPVSKKYFVDHPDFFLQLHPISEEINFEAYKKESQFLLKNKTENNNEIIIGKRKEEQT